MLVSAPVAVSPPVMQACGLTASVSNIGAAVAWSDRRRLTVRFLRRDGSSAALRHLDAGMQTCAVAIGQRQLTWAGYANGRAEVAVAPIRSRRIGRPRVLDTGDRAAGPVADPRGGDIAWSMQSGTTIAVRRASPDGATTTVATMPALTELKPPTLAAGRLAWLNTTDCCVQVAVQGQGTIGPALPIDAYAPTVSAPALTAAPGGRALLAWQSHLRGDAYAVKVADAGAGQPFSAPVDAYVLHGTGYLTTTAPALRPDGSAAIAVERDSYGGCGSPGKARVLVRGAVGRWVAHHVAPHDYLYPAAPVLMSGGRSVTPFVREDIAPDALQDDDECTVSTGPALSTVLLAPRHPPRVGTLAGAPIDFGFATASAGRRGLVVWSRRTSGGSQVRAAGIGWALHPVYRDARPSRLTRVRRKN